MRLVLLALSPLISLNLANIYVVETKDHAKYLVTTKGIPSIS